ncbi:hypothetical protein CU669_20540 [Paramagnetospirillum kuznetsovii]|uniref:HemY N-terminal domain-containing protein n=1 Tax=Paramagnetospirillum kuznetsovii TaxID=2053833 RepID=A0A364NSN5_9PROT|nr:heme biosynthesis HemY N-terminal domain-containing protein [Paramagnetospirillum kuznetsovii]RAU20042.1 hypothetical protein CU669_20540 [Paramagnetospirillum kuznetsovii]
MLLRLIVLLIFMSPVVLATLWFSDNAGMVQVEWLGWHVDTNVPVLLGTLLAVFMVFSGLARLSALVADLPTKLGKSRQARGREKGMLALLAALDAAESGDIGDGRRLGAEAARLLDSPELAARLDRLMPRSTTPPVVPPRPEQPRREQHRSEPPKGRLFAKKPSAPPVVERKPPPPIPAVVVEAPVVPAEPSAEDVATFAAKLRDGAWEAAQACIDATLSAGRLSPILAARWRAVVLEGQACLEGLDDPARPLRLAREALAADPGFLPAALHVLRLDVAEGRRAEAEAVLAAIWRTAPARILLETCAPLWRDEDADSRLRRFEALAELAPHDPDGHLAAGEAAVAVAKWGVARRHLMAALKIAPDALGCRLMAEIEDKEPGGSERAEIWRRREREAPAAPAWVCASCGAISESWAPCCSACAAGAAIQWTRPAHKPENPPVPEHVPPLAEAPPAPVEPSAAPAS